MTGVWSTIDSGSTTPLCDDTHENGCVSKFTQMHSDVKCLIYQRQDIFLFITLQEAHSQENTKKKHKQTLPVGIKTKRYQKKILVLKTFYIFDVYVSCEGK